MKEPAGRVIKHRVWREGVTSLVGKREVRKLRIAGKIWVRVWGVWI